MVAAKDKSKKVAGEPTPEPTPESVEVSPEIVSSEGVEDEVVLRDIEDVAVEVLAGKWGNILEAREHLMSAGYDASAVQAEVNHRLAMGAPSAYRATVKEVATQVIRGEWGYDENSISIQLNGADYQPLEIEAEVKRQLGG